jgi:dihydroneopterin aldolase
VIVTKVFVRGLKVDAWIGVYDHEHGRQQPLVIDVELDVAASHCEELGDTVNYETILQAAQAIAAEGHIDLVETFAERLAQASFADSRVTRARVRVEKPLALAPTPPPPGWKSPPSGGEPRPMPSVRHSARLARSSPRRSGRWRARSWSNAAARASSASRFPPSPSSAWPSRARAVAAGC